MSASLKGTAVEPPRQSLEDMAFHGKGIPRGTPLEVVVVGGKTGIIANRKAPAPVKSESKVEDSQDQLISGAGKLGELALLNGIPAGTPFEVKVHGGKTGFVPKR